MRFAGDELEVRELALARSGTAIARALVQMLSERTTGTYLRLIEELTALPGEPRSAR